MCIRDRSHTRPETYGDLQLLEIAGANPTYLGQKPALAPLLVDNDRQFQPDPSLFLMIKWLEVLSVRRAAFGVVLSLD